MSPMVYAFPAKAWKIAANARIMAPSNNLYGTGVIPGTTSKKLAAVYDSRAGTGAPLPRLVWTGKDADPDAESSTTFHGPGLLFSIIGNVYSGQQASTDEADDICDLLVRLFHHQPLAMTGFVTREARCRVVTIAEDPVGQHGIVQFESIIQVR
jgi:hypothetical protein